MYAADLLVNFHAGCRPRAPISVCMSESDAVNRGSFINDPIIP